MGLAKLIICDASLDWRRRYRIVVVRLFLEVERRFLGELLIACCVHHLYFKFRLRLLIDSLFLFVVEFVRYRILQRLRSLVSLGPSRALRLHRRFSVVAQGLGPSLRRVVGQMLRDFHCALEVEACHAFFRENFGSAPRAFYMSLTQRYTPNYDDHALAKLGRQ